jgi:outer membrane protein TolC
MKPRTLLTLLVLLFIAAPAWAQSDNLAFAVKDFIRDYNPDAVKAAAPPANPPGLMAQFIQAGEIPISLNEVVNMMVDQNLDIQSNRFTPRSSALQTLVFYKVLQPSLTVNVTWANNSSFSTSQLNGASSLGLLQNNFSVGYAKNLKWGTTIGIATTMARSKTNNSYSTFNPAYVGKITYSVSQHLLQNRGSLINLRQVYQSENNERISEAQFEIQMTALLVTAQKAYWDLVMAEKDLAVKQGSVDLAKQTLEENKQKVEIGTMARIELTQTELDVAQRADLVVGANGTVTTAQDQIKKLISSSNDSSMFLINLKAMESPHTPQPDEIPTLKEALATALENRPEIRQAMLDLKNKDIDVQYSKNQVKPSLDVSANFSQNGTGGTQRVLGNVLGGTAAEVIPGGVGDALKQMWGFNYTGYNVGFTLIIPLDNKAAKADFSRSVNERKLSDARMEATTQGIALDVRNAITQADIASKRVDTARVTLDLAQQTLAAEKAKFDAGTSILQFVLERQRDVATYESAQIQAQVNYTKALVDLDRSMGMSLKRNGLELNKAIATPGGPINKAD